MPISAGSAILVVPGFVPDEVQHRRAIADWMQLASTGKINAVGNVTLTAGTTSTTVADARAGVFSFIGLSPENSDAASAVAAGNVYISTHGKKSFTIAHPNSASTKTFRYVVLG